NQYKNVVINTFTEIITDEEVYCQYQSSHETITYSKAKLINSNQIECIISKNIFIEDTELVSIALWMNASTIGHNFTFSNDESFIKNSLKLNLPSIISEESFDS